MTEPVVYVSGVNANPTAPVTVPNIYNFRFPNWNVVVGSNRVGPQYELNNLKNRSLRLTLDSEATSSFTMSGDDSSAKIVSELESDVWWYRDGVLLHRGRVTGSRDNLTSTGNVTFGTSSYEALLDRIGLVTKPYYDEAVFDTTWRPIAAIKWLIDVAQNQSGMNLGLTYGYGQWADPTTTLTFGELYDYTGAAQYVVKVADGDSIYDSIMDICKIVPVPYEFWIDPQLRANIAQPRGTDAGVILDYEGVISDFDRSFDSKSFANLIRASGKVSPEGVDLPYAVYYGSSTESIGIPQQPTHMSKLILNTGTITPANKSLDPRGGWMSEKVNDHAYNFAGLAAFAKNEYTKTAPDADGSIEHLYSYSATFGPGQWRGPDAANGGVWLGDKVWFYAQHGRISVRRQMRVVGISIDIDAQGIETVKVDLNIARNADADLKRFRDTVKKILKKR